MFGLAKMTDTPEHRTRRLLRRGLPAVLAVVAVAGTGLASQPAHVSAATPDPALVQLGEQRVEYTGSHDFVHVPDKAVAVHIEAIGGAGGDGETGSYGGEGAKIEGWLRVSKGPYFTVTVGARGHRGGDDLNGGVDGAGGWGGDASGGSGAKVDGVSTAGGGGGATTIVSSADPDHPVVAAGGGGGGDGWDTVDRRGGGGGSAGDPPRPGNKGGGLLFSHPGAGGAAGGTDDEYTLSGGADGKDGDLPGGGGGGGVVGGNGGSGSGGSYVAGGGGGGAGSSSTGPLTDTAIQGHGNKGNGLTIFTWYTKDVLTSEHPNVVYGEQPVPTMTLPPDATGIVEFYDDTSLNEEKSIGTAPVSEGKATLATSTKTLEAGVHHLIAFYRGDKNYQAFTSNIMTVTVEKARPAMNLTADNDVVHPSQDLGLTLTLPSPASGSVGFYDDDIPGPDKGIGVAQITNGTATLHEASRVLGAGEHHIHASYGGDSNYTRQRQQHHHPHRHRVARSEPASWAHAPGKVADTAVHPSADTRLSRERGRAADTRRISAGQGWLRPHSTDGEGAAMPANATPAPLRLPPIPAVPHPDAFVGRADELTTLSRCAAAARGGTPAVVVLDGAPGIGKTELVRRFVATEAGLGVVQVTAERAAAQTPYLLLRLIEKALATELGIRRQAMSEVAMPSAAGAALLADLTRAQERRPLLVVVDNAHWIDLDSREALEFALHRLGGHRVVVLLAGWDADPSASSAGQPWPLATTRIRLTGLGQAQVAALCQAHGRPLSPAALSQLTADSGGNPLYLRCALAEAQLDRWGFRRRVPSSLAGIVRRGIAVGLRT